MDEDLKTFCGCIVMRDGRVIGRTGVVRKPSLNQYGYLMMTFYWEHKQICKTIHSIVAELYLPKPSGDGYHWIKHKNGNKTDNRVENLEWIADNSFAMHAKRRVPVQMCEPDGYVVKEFISQTAAAKYRGVTPVVISNWLLHKSKDPDGYVWKRAQQ